MEILKNLKRMKNPMEALEKGTIYTAVIDGYSSDGLGIARVNGAVVFVPHAVRGE